MVNGTEIMMAMISAISTMWPPQANVSDGSVFDFIVVGSGAGSVVANRLSECQDCSVLLIEAGGNPTEATSTPANFAALPNTNVDWNFTAEIEPTSISQEVGRFLVSHGKVLGGCSSINHFIKLNGHPSDFNDWANLLDDSGLQYENILTYLKKFENLKDENIMNSEYRKFHGDSGLVNITTQPSDVATEYLEAFAEIGHVMNPDVNSDNMMGYGLGQYTSDYVRQDSATTYILNARNRPNFHVLTNAFVNKIIIENKVAVGVELTLDDVNIKIKANREVIVSAGVVNSPKLLSLSGIGKKDVLEKYDIPVVSDLSVGENYQEHVAVPIVFKMNYSTVEQSTVMPEKIPFPILLGSVSPKGEDAPEYQSTCLLLEHDTDFLMAACSTIFGLKTDICTMFVNECEGRDAMFCLIAKYKPASRGVVEIQSADPSVDPKIWQNLYGNETDLLDMIGYLENFIEIGNSTYFKNAGAEYIMPEIEDCSESYWKCYALNHTVKLFHPTSTCPMGSVLDSNCKVKGVEGLRVVDSSSLPDIPRANPWSTIVALAELMSDRIKESHPDLY